MSDVLQGAEQQATAVQTQHRLLQLSNQLAQLQQTLEVLRTESDQNGQQLTTLVHHFTNAAALQPVYTQLAALTTGLDAAQERLDQLVHTSAQQEQLERLIAVVASQKQVDELVDGLKKQTRTQFKSNTLVESKEQQVEQALAALRELATRREQPQSAADQRQSERLHQARLAARVEFGAELLPALDSIELALANGEALLARQQARIATINADATAVPPAPAVEPMAPTSFWQRLFGPPAPALPAPPAAPPAPPERALLPELLEGTRAWLTGLRLVQERFVGLLAAEGIEPIVALHQPFDPKLHVALEMVTRRDVAPNTVVRVMRQGYRRQEQVLRYAEVVVARHNAEGE